MKKLAKISAGAMTLVLLTMGGAQAAMAQTASTTATTTLAAQVSALLQQIKTLQDKLAELQKQQGQLVTQLQSVLQLSRQLGMGMSGDDVKALQQMLANDPEIYPEGLITGYYGSLTEKAIKKFQAKYGLEQVGRVGPKTLEKFNELMRTREGRSGKLMDENGYFTASSSVSGLENMKGVVCHKPDAYSAGITLVVGLPAVYAHLGHGDRIGPCTGSIVPPQATTTATSTATTTPDVTAPIISSVAASSTNATTTEVKWTTNENSTGAVWYGTSTPLSLNGDPNSSNSTLVSLHSFSLGNLATGTTYYFVVKSVDAAGNVATSSQQSFVTPAQ